MLVVAICFALPASAQRLIVPEIEDVFATGTAAEFGTIRSMAFAPDGKLLVLDDHMVVVLDTVGNEMFRWGGEGEGPSEFVGPSALSVSGQSVVAVADRSRVGTYTITGTPIDTYSSLSVGVVPTAVVFSGEHLIVMTMHVYTGDTKAMRLPDGATVWESRNAGTRRLGRQLFMPRPSLVGIGSGLVAATDGSSYLLPVIDVASLDSVGQVSRNVNVRRVTNAFAETVRNYLVNPAMAPEGWTSIVGTSGRSLPEEIVSQLHFPETFPVVGAAFAGPGNILWVRRGVGVGDALAFPLDPPDAVRTMFDLFSLDDYRYVGTVEMNDEFLPVAADAHRLAGITTGIVPHVRVVRVRYPR